MQNVKILQNVFVVMQTLLPKTMSIIGLPDQQTQFDGDCKIDMAHEYVETT